MQRPPLRAWRCWASRQSGFPDHWRNDCLRIYRRPPGMPLRNFFIRSCAREHFSFGGPRTVNDQSGPKSVCRKNTVDEVDVDPEQLEGQLVLKDVVLAF